MNSRKEQSTQKVRTLHFECRETTDFDIHRIAALCASIMRSQPYPPGYTIDNQCNIQDPPEKKPLLSKQYQNMPQTCTPVNDCDPPEQTSSTQNTLISDISTAVSNNRSQNYYNYTNMDPEAPLSRNGGNNPMNFSTNVLLTYRLQEMRDSEYLNFMLALLCLCYCAINAMLIYINYCNSHTPPNEEPPVSDYTYHLIEFWGTFGFALIECASLVISTPKSLLQIYYNPIVLKLLLFFNIVATLVPALMVTLNLEVFEITSHNIEYMNELTMTFVDMVLFFSLFEGKDNEGNGKRNSTFVSQEDENRIQYRNKVIATVVSGVVAVFQLAVYNGMGKTDNGDMVGEVPAHYLEFVFEIISSMIAFWFCMDNKFVAAKEIGLILYGKHSACNICDAKSFEFEKTYSNRYLNPLS